MLAKHAGAHDLGANIGEVVFRVIIIDTGGPGPVGVLKNKLTIDKLMESSR